MATRCPLSRRTILGAGLAAPFALARHPAAAQTPLPAAKTQLVPFDISPFPYRGTIPEKGTPFLDVVNGERRGHTSPRGGIYWESLTYSDRRVLLSIPRGFDARRPTVVVVFFHGNQATLARDVRDRQQVPRQVAESGLNAVLVAPQFAVDALDSSGGRFWEPGVFAKFLDEAVERLTRLHGDPRARATFVQAPVVLVAYSGGYNPAAFVLAGGGANARIQGVVLLDALFGETSKFADWIAKHPQTYFVSAYGRSAREEHAALRRMLEERGVSIQASLPARLTPGSVTLIAAGDEVQHMDFVTRAWVADPLKTVLARVPGFPRAPSANEKSKPGNR